MSLRSECRVVLLAEDDVLVRNLVRYTLETAGFTVLAASDGLEALTFSYNYPGRIDVLLTDIDMPHLDGISLAERIKEQRPETLVLLISGGLPSAVRIREMDVKFLAKPFSPDLLVQAVRNLIVEASE